MLQVLNYHRKKTRHNILYQTCTIHILPLFILLKNVDENMFCKSNVVFHVLKIPWVVYSLYHHHTLLVNSFP